MDHLASNMIDLDNVEISDLVWQLGWAHSKEGQIELLVTGSWIGLSRKQIHFPPACNVFSFSFHCNSGEMCVLQPIAVLCI